MLESISIQNYALISQLNVDFNDGLNVITGETGAGKSIIIDAISLLLGARAKRGNIRNGKDKMIVSGQFSVENKDKVKEILDKYGIDFDDNLILTRKITKGGRSTSLVNGTNVPLTLFNELGTFLVDIHSQHEHVSLFKSETQRELLDLYGGKELLNSLANVREQALKLKDLANKIRQLQMDSKEAKRAHSINQFQLKEIREANLSKNEEEELQARVKELSKQELLFNETSITDSLLSGNDEESGSLSDQLEALAVQINKLSGIDSYFKPYNDQVNNILSEFNSLSYDLSSYLDKLDFNPDELNQIQERLSKIDELKGKYGENIEEVLKFADELEEKINLYENSDYLLETSKIEYNKTRNDYNLVAHSLSDQRSQSAKKLKAELEQELKDLAMEKARVEIRLETDNDIISPNGQDKVDFLISVNPGIEPAELKKVASGGEISRIMLAIKGIFGEKDQVETLIFDEIDTGISGRTAQVVAEKMNSLAEKRQIICITHLPQIAAMADNQFVVEKISEDENTEVKFKQLEAEQRPLELARMLGGAQVTELTKQSAIEMLDQAQSLKMSRND